MSDGNGKSTGKLSIDCGPADSQGKRLVVAKCNGHSHRDRFAVDSAFHRGKFRDAVISRFAWGDDAHEAIEASLIQAADNEDARAESEISRPRLVTLATVEAQETEWLWEGYIPQGAITIIDGDPGLGKSQLTVDLAARITRGDAMPPHTAPDSTYKPGGVLLLSCEDDASRTIKPRLDAAGADVTRVHLLAAIESSDGEEDRQIILPLDVPIIERIIIDHGVVLVLIDPLVAYLASDISANNDADVRRCLSPVAAMAERTKAAVLAIRHLNKKPGGAAMYRGGGSIGIVGAARAAFVVAQDPDDNDLRIFAPVKMNLAPMPRSLAFTIEAHGATSRVAWQGHHNATANELLASGGRQAGSKMDRAREIIAEILASGPRGENEVRGACESEGIGEKTYKRARKALGVLSERVGFGTQGEWMLTLPSRKGGAVDAEY